MRSEVSFENVKCYDICENIDLWEDVYYLTLKSDGNNEKIMREFYWKEKGIYYRKNEWRPSRLTLVFVHGISGSASVWLPYEETFKNKYNILLYDIRGHGMSKKYPHYKDYDIKNFANDLHDLVAQLNIKKFVLISNSFAGLLALEYLKSWRETVLMNVFTSPEVFMDKKFMAKFIRLAFGLIAGILKFLPFNPKPRGHVDYKEYIGATDWSMKRTLADIKNTGLHANFFTLRQSLTPEMEYELEKIKVPTLVLHGEKDSLVPIKNAVALSKEIKNAEFIMLSSVDHYTVHNAVKLMSEAIEHFIEKNKANLSY